MLDNKKEVRRIIIAAAAVWLISLLVFIWLYLGTGNTLMASVIYGVWNLVVFFAAYLKISKNVNKVLQGIDACIQSIIDGKPRQLFPPQEESLLGKFQSQIMKLYQILDAAREQEEKQHEELSGLVADLVHQINTPLTNLQMYAGFLTQDDLSPEEKLQIKEVIDAQVEKMGWFAEGFVKTMRLETDIRKLNPRKQPILDMVLSAVDQISLKAKKHGNEIELAGDQNIQAMYDRRWTEEAVFNILENAVKYGEEKMPVCIRLTAYELFARIDIMNYGDVIPQEEYPRIFKRYYRGRNAALIKEGVGLGLYLSREIISEQGGYIKVSSAKGMGNIFSIFLKK